MSDYLRIVEDVAAGAVARRAVDVDRDGVFPEESIAAIRGSGLFGLISSAEAGGFGHGPRAACEVVERLARECGSTAMIMCMHYAGTAVIEKHGPIGIRRDIAAGRHLSTLAFSETGSRSHFWVPVSSAERKGDGIHLNASKGWVTSANQADGYVWTSRPIEGDGASTVWLVPRDTPGVEAKGAFDGLGLRGNDSTPVVADDAVIAESNILGADGGGPEVVLGTVLPLFNAMTSSVAVGLMEAATTRTAEHVTGTRYEYASSTLAELPTIRAYLARMRVATDQARGLLLDTIAAMENGRQDAMLRVLECKCAAGEAATQVTDTAMRVCGGSAFRRDVGVERVFRDARAGTVMAPTTDQLYDFIGRMLCDLPLF
ncbi:MAG: acyl-CoA dehydrogenase [Myxococcales bacterium]|jgi:alkylation response protein AidB-like acyl-CoA dehydrogenase|nr:MAG: acyl-CoA dehydrogenase [Myxococcales bacterium]